MSRINYLKIGNIARLGDGAHTKVERLESGIPYLSAQNIKGGYIDFSNASFISNSDYNRFFSESKNSVRDLQKDDILFSIIGTIGNLYKYKSEDKFGVSSSVAIIRPNQKIVDADYLFWLLRSKAFASLMNRKKGGSVQGYTNLPLIRDTEIPIPNSIIEQQKIASVLSSLDAKIALNNRINTQLESMAKLIYDYWFVQFDFPDANGKPYKSSGGKMVYNKELKREIPEGWEVKELNEIASIKAGGDKPKNCVDVKSDMNSIPIYANGNTNEGLYGYTDVAKVEKQSITISARGTIGFCVLRNEPFVPIIRLLVVTPNQEGTAKFYFEQLRSLVFENSGSVQQQITVPQISSMKVIVPSQELLAKYELQTASGIANIEVNKKQNQQLASLRDWLLPMLMNGQVRVKDVEEKVSDLLIAAEPKGEYKTK